MIQESRLKTICLFLNTRRLDWSHEAIKQTCIQKLLSVHQELVRDRDAGLTKLNNCVESGERLYGSTAPDGREVIRQDLRKLKLGWDSLYDDLSAVQRRLEVSLVQWTSFDESYGQVENWLRDMESQLEGQIPLRSTLEEKKTQQQNYKVDVCSVTLFLSPCLLYTSPSPRDDNRSRMPSSA